MKKIVLAGIILIVLIVLIIVAGRASEFSWGGAVQGSRPSQLWVRQASEDMELLEREGSLILKEMREGTTSINGIDYYGREIWEEAWEGSQEIIFDRYYWGHTQLSEGTISIYDYQGKLVRKAKVPADYKHYWLGPQGEIMFSRSASTGQERLEGLYGEKAVVYNARGDQVYQESYAGQGILDMILLPGTNTLVANRVEIFPYLSANVVFFTLEGRRLQEAKENQLFFSPVIIEENQWVALASGTNVYLYSFEGVPLFKKEWEGPVKDVFAGPGETLLLVISQERTLKDQTSLVCLDHKGNLVWERELPGRYRQGKSRAGQGIVIETDLFLYLLYPDGNTYANYAPQEEQEIYLLSTDTFIAREKETLKAYHWPIQ